jgi:oligoribonuclease NrnB/cAMP/cGMP phosphodiesterase (DHH superfamily)
MTADTLCFHHDDADGCASGAIVRYALGDMVQLYSMDVSDRRIPWDLVSQFNRVIVVDLSFPLPEMQRIANGRELIWIDHHISALTGLKKVSKNWPGLRSLSSSACVLTWKYFFPKRPVPHAVILIGDRDIWRWAEKDTGAFSEGLHARDSRAGNDSLWIPLFEDNPFLLREIISEGQRLREIHLASSQRQIERYGFEVEFEGHRTLAINTHGNGDLGQQGRDLGYEIIYCYMDQMICGQLTTVVTLFSKHADVSMIAQKYHGGGHHNAAGFSFPRNNTPFPRKSNVKWKERNTHNHFS